MFPAIIIGLVALVGVCPVVEMFFDHAEAVHAAQHESDEAGVRRLQTALIEAESSVRGYVLTGQPEFLEPFLSASKTLNGSAAGLLGRLDQYASAQVHANGIRRLPSEAVAELRSNWENAVHMTADRQPAKAAAGLMAPEAKDVLNHLREDTAGYAVQRSATYGNWNRRMLARHAVLYKLSLGGVLIAIAAMLYAFGNISRAITAGFAAQQQVVQLFFMADMLQSAAGQEDTNEVLRAAAANMLPGFSGALYVFNNSRDRLDLSMQWGGLADPCADHLVPADCWALKRGKPHLNGVGARALRCGHTAPGRATLEIPMAARGQLYGLLEISGEGDGAETRLADVQPVATAMADAMSLALSSIALRERLRNQALRDPLTSLYNRRFLEETLERMCLEVERRKSSIAAIMIDIDHFKKLNDQHGHGAGDAVLRDVAVAVLSCIRRVDVACRYGGEEFAILLPDCSMATAIGKAEQIRSAIAGLTGAAGASVTASLGVASIPETSGGAADLLAAADAALYEAKQQGRDRVVAARSRPFAQRLNLIEPEPAGFAAE